MQPNVAFDLEFGNMIECRYLGFLNMCFSIDFFKILPIIQDLSVKHVLQIAMIIGTKMQTSVTLIALNVSLSIQMVKVLTFVCRTC